MTTVTGKCIPTSAVALKFYGLPKIHNVGTPYRPIVSSRGSITYGVAKEVTNIICPLVGQSPHHLKNTQQFMQHIKEVMLQPGEVMTSYDTKALFTSVPMDPSINHSQTQITRGPTAPTKDQHVLYEKL